MKNILFIVAMVWLVVLSVSADNNFTTNLNMGANNITNVGSTFTSNITAYCYRDAKGNVITDFGALTANMYPQLVTNIAHGLDQQLSNWVVVVVTGLTVYTDAGIFNLSNYTCLLVRDLSNHVDSVDATKVDKAGDTMVGSLTTSNSFVVAGVTTDTNLYIGITGGSIGFRAKCGGVFPGGLAFDGKQWELTLAALGPFTSSAAVVPRSYIDSGLSKASNYTAKVAVGLTNYVDGGLAGTGDFMRIQAAAVTENVAITNEAGNTITTLKFTDGVYIGHE